MNAQCDVPQPSAAAFPETDAVRAESFQANFYIFRCMLQIFENEGVILLTKSRTGHAVSWCYG